MRVAVVGHVESVEFVRVPRVPRPGDIVHATEWWSAAAGGGAVAAVQCAKLAGTALFLTALGGDDRGTTALAELRAAALDVRASFRSTFQRRAVTYLDDAGERTITVLGERLGPEAADDLGWDLLQGADAVYVTAADVEGIRRARDARVLVATSRIVELLARARVQVDVLVGSAADPSEQYARGQIDPEPRVVIRTDGARGGAIEYDDGRVERFEPAPLPGPVVDAYGCGDSFAGALTYGLASGMSLRDAVALAARAGASVLTGRGPYAAQLRGEGAPSL